MCQYYHELVNKLPVIERIQDLFTVLLQKHR